MKMEQTQCTETSAIKHVTPENNPKITHDIRSYWMTLRRERILSSEREISRSQYVEDGTACEPVVRPVSG
jgi:hypothetical protein